MESVREFSQMKKNEEVLLAVYHKSLIPYSKSFLLSLLIVPVFVMIGVYLPSVLTLPQAIALLIIITGLLLLRSWYLWNRSLFLLTSLRIVFLDQKGLFYRETYEAYFDDVCQVGAKVKGLMRHFFDYGDVLIQTQAELWLKDIERPHDFKEAVFAALHKRKHHDTQALPKKFWKEKSSRN